ncbi:DUF551 domain-containing protein [Serratia proteamaculans]|uniref:DUF551 domain-containing protein n=1 Tax=Serratia proteamaculans TaxID=28151 RepID=UPI0039BE1605
MTHTLTTERLREIAERRSPSLRWGEAEQIATELLANRETQPVAVTDEMALAFHRALNDGGIGESDLEEIKVGLRGALCNITAPPAPVVNPEFTGATAVPEAIITAPVEAMRCGPAASYVMGWNACRAAMLAQPVRRGCTVVPLGWIDCAFRVPDTDGNYWGWWSESKRQGPVWFIKSDVQAQFQSSEITHWMPLPAAPEGGNEK